VVAASKESRLPNAPFIVHVGPHAVPDVQRLPPKPARHLRKLLRLFGRTGKLPRFKGHEAVQAMKPGTPWFGWWRIAFGDDTDPRAEEWRAIFEPNERKGWIRVDVVAPRADAYGRARPG
jgi:hypothetical protein